MPSALKFVGGGLLQGIGKGLALQGKAKREAALKKFEQDSAQKRALELEGVRQEGRRGLLDATNAAASERLDTNIASREGVARAATTSRETLASEATTSREGIASEATASRERVGTAANISREKAAKITAGKATDTTAAEDRIIKRHPVLDEFGVKTDEIDHEAAAVELEENGFKKAAQAQRRKGKGIADLDLDKRAREFADAMVDEQSHPLVPDSIDFADDGGSRVQFHARMVREFIAKNGGKPAAAPETKQAARPPATEPPAAEPPADRPEVTGPYVGATPPRDHPDARRADDGFWYVKRDGKFLRVQNTEANRASRSEQDPR